MRGHGLSISIVSVVVGTGLAIGLAVADTPAPTAGAAGSGSGSGGSIKVAKAPKPQPFRWQVPDGTTYSFRLIAPADETPKLEVTHGDDFYDLALTGATRELAPVAFAIGEDVVVSTASTPGAAWRLAVKKGRFAVAKTAAWDTDKARPAWAAEPVLKTPAQALAQIAALLRFGGSVPGLDRFFGDTTVKWNVFTRGDKQPWKRSMTAREVLGKWVGAGYPVIRGKLAVKKGCMTLPANADGKPAAPAAPPEAPHLLRMCVDADLHVVEVDTLIAPSPDGKGAAVMPSP